MSEDEIGEANRTKADGAVRVIRAIRPIVLAILSLLAALAAAYWQTDVDFDGGVGPGEIGP